MLHVVAVGVFSLDACFLVEPPKSRGFDVPSGHAGRVVRIAEEGEAGVAQEEEDGHVDQEAGGAKVEREGARGA